MIAANSASSSSYEVRIRPLIDGSTDRTSRQTSMPLPSGSRASSTATSGRSAGMRCAASTAEPDSPTTSMSPSRCSRSRTPARTTSWSSSRKTRIMFTFIPDRRPAGTGQRSRAGRSTRRPLPVSTKSVWPSWSASAARSSRSSTGRSRGHGDPPRCAGVRVAAVVFTAPRAPSSDQGRLACRAGTSGSVPRPRLPRPRGRDEGGHDVQRSRGPDRGSAGRAASAVAAQHAAVVVAGRATGCSSSTPTAVGSCGSSIHAGSSSCSRVASRWTTPGPAWPPPDTRPVVRRLVSSLDDNLLAEVSIGAARDAVAGGSCAWREAIQFRRTDRRPFADTPVADETVQALRSAAESAGAGLHLVGAHQMPMLAVAVAQAGEVELDDPSYREELIRWTNRPPWSGDGVPADTTVRRVPRRVPVRTLALEPNVGVPIQPDGDRGAAYLVVHRAGDGAGRTGSPPARRSRPCCSPRRLSALLRRRSPT